MAKAKENKNRLGERMNDVQFEEVSNDTPQADWGTEDDQEPADEDITIDNEDDGA